MRSYRPFDRHVALGGVRGVAAQERVEVKADVQGVDVRGDKHMALRMRTVALRTHTLRHQLTLPPLASSHARAPKGHVCVLLKCGEVRTLYTCAYTLQSVTEDFHRLLTKPP